MATECKLCGKDFGFMISPKDIEKCNLCGKPYHKECFNKKQNSMKIPAKVAILIFPARRQKILDHTKEWKAEQLNRKVSDLELWSEEQILENASTKVCKFCADEAKGKALEVAKQLEVAMRFEDALLIYDQFNMFEDAGRVRGVMGKAQPTNVVMIERARDIERPEPRENAGMKRKKTGGNKTAKGFVIVGLLLTIVGSLLLLIKMQDLIRGLEAVSKLIQGVGGHDISDTGLYLLMIAIGIILAQLGAVFHVLTRHE